MPTTNSPAPETEDANEIEIQRISSGFPSGTPLDHTMDRIGIGHPIRPSIPNFISYLFSQEAINVLYCLSVA